MLFLLRNWNRWILSCVAEVMVHSLPSVKSGILILNEFDLWSCLGLELAWSWFFYIFFGRVCVCVVVNVVVDSRMI